jgi:hypothetical protein
MNAVTTVTNSTLPYFSLGAARRSLSVVFSVALSIAERTVKSVNVRITTSSMLACIVGFLLLASRAPDLGVVPANEIIPLEDTNADLTLTEVVAHFERHPGTYPKNEAYKLGKLVMDLSERHQFSPSLILAVIDAESSFRPDVVSKAGAVGLMQLLPSTAEMVAKVYHVRQYHSEADLSDPAVNLRLGVAYLAYLRHQFGHSLHYLAAYNVGPGALKKRLGAGRYELGSLDGYVRKIHSRAREIGGAPRKLHSLAREEALMAASI